MQAKQTVKPEGQRAVNGEVAGESTAPVSLHRKAKASGEEQGGYQDAGECCSWCC